MYVYLSQNSWNRQQPRRKNTNVSLNSSNRRPLSTNISFFHVILPRFGNKLLLSTPQRESQNRPNNPEWGCSSSRRTIFPQRPFKTMPRIILDDLVTSRNGRVTFYNRLQDSPLLKKVILVDPSRSTSYMLRDQL